MVSPSDGVSPGPFHCGPTRPRPKAVYAGMRRCGHASGPVRGGHGLRMAATEMPVVRLTSPGEIAAAIPHLCGFVPSESLVAVSLRGDRRRIGLSLRFDLPAIEAVADTANAEEVASRLAHDGASAIVLVVYTEQAGPRPLESLV